MQLSQIFPTQNTTYTWFFYLGILFFISHLSIFGFGINLSYFGMILIYIGYAKPVLSTWFTRLLWVFIFLDMYANYSALKTKLEGRHMVKISRENNTTMDDSVKKEKKKPNKKG